MATPRARLAVAVAAVALVLAAGACSGRPEPGPRPAEPSSPPVSEGSAPEHDARPSLPPAAHGNSGSAARAFVHFWLDTLNHALESGDAASLAAISSPQCRACGRIVETIDEIHARGGRLSGGTWRITSLRPLPVDRGADWAGYVTAAVSPQELTQPGKDRTYAAGQGFMYTYAARHRGSWRMVWMHISV